VDVLGVAVTSLTATTLNRHIRDLVSSGDRELILHVNAHALNLAWSAPELRRILHDADLVFCDGAGPMLAARLSGERIVERITYADWLPEFASFAAKEGISMFLLGGRAGVAEAAAGALRKQAPGLRIVGTHHGYFDKSSGSEENVAVLDAINRADPDVLLVGFGMPIQEEWLSDNWDLLRARVGLSAGAALDYMSGSLARGPRWMTSNGLEWLARLLIEPRRLWRRYLLGNPVFVARAVASRFRKSRAEVDKRDAG
jgi:N-acetylglucosaminyldiphosphoundecaprenol N-acetyl-beta-D-mannosaminyltransferase